jgi:hypothetical protein
VGESLYQDEHETALCALTGSLTAIYAASVQEWDTREDVAMIYQRCDLDRAGYGVVFLLTILVMMGSIALSSWERLRRKPSLKAVELRVRLAAAGPMRKRHN